MSLRCCDGLENVLESHLRTLLSKGQGLRSLAKHYQIVVSSDLYDTTATQANKFKSQDGPRCGHPNDPITDRR